MLPMIEAVQRILSGVRTMEEEVVGLHDAVGRVAASDVRAPAAIPPWDNSAMDGYAVRAADAVTGASLELIGTVGAGSVLSRALGQGEAAAIMTGAPVPDGADAVVIVENTDGAHEGVVTLASGVEPGANIRRKGADVPEGTAVVTAGQRLTPARVGLIAATGAPRVAVRRKPRIAVLPTGNEIIRPGTALAPGQIYSSNPYALVGLLRELGADAVDLGDGPDDLDALVALLEGALHHDAIVTTGGVSVGRFDLVKEAFARLGVVMDFWKVRMKPGKPLAFGRLEHDGHTTTFFGLPGNPVSCMVNTHQFVAPWIRASLGEPRPFPGVVRARMLEDVRERPGRAKLLRVVLCQTADGFGARSTGSQSSGALSSMGRADGLLLLASDQGGVREGEVVDVQLLDPGFLQRAVPAYPA